VSHQTSYPPVDAPESVKRSRVAKALRVLAIPIILFWVLVAALANLLVPSLEETTQANAGAMVPRDAPSSQAALLIGKAFRESNSSSVAVIMLETHQRKLGEQDHQYYTELVRRLRQDTKHVQSVMDLWADPVTMSGQQSADAEAVTLTVRPTGDQGDAIANQAVEAIRGTVEHVPTPAGLTAYVTGPSPLAADTLHAADKSMGKLTIVTVVLIIALLLFVYRSIAKAVIPLVGVLIVLAAARGIISFLVDNHVIGISSFASNMLVSLVLGATTDYAIFLQGKFQEARRAGQDKETAYYTAVRNVSHVIIGSGLAISGATLCLSLTHLDYFRTLGPPCSVSMVIAVIGGLTLGPALLTVGSRLNLPEPHNAGSARWRQLGTIIARWPAPMLAVSLVVVPLCILGLANYRVSYNDRDFQPASTESSIGYAVADKHFPTSWLSTDTIYLQSDHDMRNTTDMISLDRLAKNIFRVPGIALVQSVTRPNGRPMEHASLPFAMGSAGTMIGENIGFLRDRIADIDKMAASTARLTESTKRMAALTSQIGAGSHITRESSDRLKAITDESRDDLADFDDLFRPIRSYFYWERHCYNIPICSGIRSLYDAIDTVDKIAEELGNTSKGIAVIDQVTPQLVNQMHTMTGDMVTMQKLILTFQSFLQTTVPQLDSMIQPLISMAQAFDNAKNDDFFFLPPAAFNTPDFKVGLNFFMTPDGKATRINIFHKGEAMSATGIKQIEDASAAAEESLKGTSLSSSKLYVAGTSASYRDVRDFARNDVMIMMLATFTLVFLIILFMTRALAAACVVLVTVMLSFAAAFGLSVFIWQNLIGLQLHWLTLPIAFIVLVAVGCDYNLLLLSTYKEELGAGIKTGLIRTMGSSGSVVITASFVFAFTMLALVSSDVKNIGQAGSTICIGLILDMLIVRMFMVLPLARLLGRWFWWPLKIQSLKSNAHSKFHASHVDER